MPANNSRNRTPRFKSDRRTLKTLLSGAGHPNDHAAAELRAVSAFDGGGTIVLYLDKDPVPGTYALGSARATYNGATKIDDLGTATTEPFALVLDDSMSDDLVGDRLVITNPTGIPMRDGTVWHPPGVIIWNNYPDASGNR